MIQIIFENAPLVAKQSNNTKIKSNNTNTTVTRNNNFVGKTFNFTKLNNKYIVAATDKIEKMTPNTFPTLFGFFLFFCILISP